MSHESWILAHRRKQPFGMGICILFAECEKVDTGLIILLSSSVSFDFMLALHC